MQKALITGASGTVGQALAARLRRQGVAVVAWDRAETPIDQYQVMEDYVRHTAPDVLYHLAIASQPTGRADESWYVNYEWPSELAWIARVLDVRLVFTSTAVVFSDAARGPFTLDALPDAAEGYGYEKRRAEERVLHQNPDAVIARLGWQIGDRPGSNNMIDHFHRQMEAHGVVRASRRWFPACSFLPDTAAALLRLAGLPPGIYMLDSNRRWTFYEIACALNDVHGNPWHIEPTDDLVFDQRLIDPRPAMPPLDDRLPDLP